MLNQDTAICESPNESDSTGLGISKLAPEVISQAVTAIREFDNFKASNDPWNEHDFGQVIIDGEMIMWKIDYYDINLEWGSPDPADETVNCRVMTILTAQDL